MKFKSQLGTNPGRTRAGNLMISPSAVTGLGEVVSKSKKWVVNWQTQSAKFTIFNNQIRALDGMWHELTPPNQDPWNTAAAVVSMSRGCGCPLHILTGQTLWRNVNLNLWMRGLPITHLPPDVTGWLGTGVTEMQNNYSPPWTTQEVQIYPGDGSHSNNWLFLSDPNSALWVYAPTPMTGPWEFFVGDPIYEFCFGFDSDVTLQWCTSLDSGLPSQSGKAILYHSR